MDLLTSLNLNIAAIWVRDPWVSIQINFWGSLLSRKQVAHTCKILFLSRFSLDHFFPQGPLASLNLNITPISVRDPSVSI